MDAQSQKTISHTQAPKEGYKSTHPWFSKLKAQGLNPLSITMDGERSVIKAIREVWPQTKIQRCLFHIQREALRWLRSCPKTQAAKDLRHLLSEVCIIRSVKEQNRFIENFNACLNHYQSFIDALPVGDVAFKDLKRTVVLIKNALPDMFYYLQDSNIQHTTNTLESFHSRLKSDYQRHRGLNKLHKSLYLNWYCYFKNQSK